jgi:hypothetical protein
VAAGMCSGFPAFSSPLCFPDIWTNMNSSPQICKMYSFAFILGFQR